MSKTLVNMTRDELVKHGPYYGSIKSLTFRLKEAGFTFLEVDNGGDYGEEVDVSEMSTQKIAQEICAVDEARLFCKDPDGKKVGIFIVLGNDFCENMADFTQNAHLEKVWESYSDYWTGKKVVYAKDLGLEMAR